MKFHVLAIITALTLPALAIADDKTTTKSSEKAAKLSDADLKVIAHLHHVNQVEIDLGKAAQKTATAANTNVKNYGAMLEKDHQNLDKELTAFVKKHGHSSIPADKAETDAEKQEQKDMNSRITHLKTLKGTDFDKEFVTMMVTEHDREISRLDPAINASSDPDFQATLKSAKLVLQRHADEARELQKNLQASTDQPTVKQPASR